MQSTYLRGHASNSDIQDPRIPVSFDSSRDLIKSLCTNSSIYIYNVLSFTVTMSTSRNANYIHSLSTPIHTDFNMTLHQLTIALSFTRQSAKPSTFSSAPSCHKHFNIHTYHMHTKITSTSNTFGSACTLPPKP